MHVTVDVYNFVVLCSKILTRNHPFKEEKLWDHPLKEEKLWDHRLKEEKLWDHPLKEEKLGVTTLALARGSSMR
jgi:hypothetical protein